MLNIITVILQVKISTANSYLKLALEHIASSGLIKSYDNNLIIITGSKWTYFIPQHEIINKKFVDLFDFYIFIRNFKVNYRLKPLELVMRIFNNCNTVDQPLHKSLTHNEQEVMRHLLCNLSVNEISKLMDLQIRAVSRHKMSVLRKLHLRNIQELIIDMNSITQHYTTLH